MMGAMGTCTLGILSDIHYASAAEQARGRDFEFRRIANPLARGFAKVYRRFFWLREPLSQNHLLDRFLETAFGGSASHLVLQVLGNHKASKEELEQIKNLINKLEGE